MLRTTATAVILALTLVTGLTMSGCETAKSAGLSYDLGTMSAKVPAPLTKVVDAAESTLNDYGVNINNLDKKADSAVIEGKTKSGGPVTINMKKLNDSQTELKVATDMFGDYDESLKIVKGVFDKLGVAMP